MGLKILISDDSAFMRTILKNAINTTGQHTILDGKDGQEAVDIYAKEKPDLAFMDIMMPNKTGLEALKEIKSKFPDAKIIMCTSVGQDKIIQEAVDAGASDFVTKPFKPQDIVEIIKKYNG